MLTVKLVNTAWKFFSSFEIVTRIDQVINAPGRLFCYIAFERNIRVKNNKYCLHVFLITPILKL